MQVKIESSQGLERKIRVSIPADDYDNAVKNNLRQLGRRARIDGFRPGKAPMKVLDQRFGGRAREEALSDLLEKTYPQALQEVDLQPAGQPRIEIDEAAAEGEMAYIATFDVYPVIEPQGLEGMSIDEPQVEVSDEDVDKLLQKLRTQRQTFEDKGGPAAEGDKVKIDFSGTVNGEEFAGGQGEDVTVDIGAGRFLKGMEDGLIGMNAGEEKQIPVTFPDDYHAEELQGQTAQFEVSMKGIEVAVLPEVDDEFCQAFGVESGGESALRDKLRTSMEKERDQAARRFIKGQVMDALLKANEIEVPQALVDREIERMRQEASQRFGGQQQIPPEQLHQLFPDEVFADQARRRTALGLLIGEIIKQRSIEADAEKVEAQLKDMASDFDDSEAAINYYRGNREMMMNIESMVLEDQVVDTCLATAKMKSKPMGFEELTQQSS